VYPTELTSYFEQHGWTCDDCKACIVCDESPSESEKSEDLLVRSLHFHIFLLLYLKCLNSSNLLYAAGVRVLRPGNPLLLPQPAAREEAKGKYDADAE
jgi:hypothetical protein